MNRRASIGDRPSSRPATLLVVLSVVILVVLAGCVGGGGSSGGDVGGSETGGSAAGTDGPSEDDGSGESGGTDGTGTGDGGGASGEGDGASDGSVDTGGMGPEEAARVHAANLREFGSYTATYAWTMEGNDTSEEGFRGGSFRGTVRADLEAGSARVVQTMEGESGRTTDAELYLPAGEDTVYTRLDAGGSAVYRTAQREESRLTLFTDPMGGTDALPSTGVDADAGSLAGYRDEGVVSTTAGPRHRYVIEGLPSTRVENTSESPVADYRAEVLVDPERGIITDYLVEVTFAGDSGSDLRSFGFELTYRDVGSTTVRAPEWLDEAKAGAQSG